jgi:putative selenium metabolism hydrolase
MHTTSHTPEIISFLQQLIRQPSLSGRESGAARVVKAKMESMDFDDVWIDAYGSVVGIRSGTSPGPQLLFDAHMDVVPVTNPDSWRYPPFGGEVHDGRVWGRGATDIKGGLAAMIIALGRLRRDAFSGTLILSASIGEEQIEGLAMKPIVAASRPDFVIISEPTSCQIAAAQKGRTEFWIDIEGRPAHTSRPELGDNAIYRAMPIISALRNLKMPTDPVLSSGVMELIEIQSNPFPGECIVPYGCHLRYDRRLVSGETQASIRVEIEQALLAIDQWKMAFQSTPLRTYTGIDLNNDCFYPGWVLDSASPWLAKARQALHSVGLPDAPLAVPYCTHASYTAGIAKIPTIIFGPSTIELAHVTDESIEIEELEKAADGFTALAQHLLHGS